ncbi:hypothetical protein DXG03_007530 [Asterophora parasitica]|uniref:Uncharacterized protein n=1 Tax=Asterophora parasitica TaxID=117018 RepID=A0A9P7G4I9_9AGAR|nr:hypothetical protein DXG03_007530 [Asterophora parasitica]
MEHLPLFFCSHDSPRRSHFVFHKEPSPTGDVDIAGNNLSCDLDGKGGGACVNEHWVKGEPTATSAYTGSAIPYYTVVVEPESIGKGDSNGGNGNVGKDNAAVKSAAGWGVLALGVLVGALQVN